MTWRSSRPARGRRVGLRPRRPVSRGPVREALRILERDGLVQINARRGAQVTQLDIDEVNDLFEVRASLIGLAARLAAERRDPQLIARMRASLERLAEVARKADA